MKTERVERGRRMKKKLFWVEERREGSGASTDGPYSTRLLKRWRERERPGQFERVGRRLELWPIPVSHFPMLSRCSDRRESRAKWESRTRYFLPFARSGHSVCHCRARAQNINSLSFLSLSRSFFSRLKDQHILKRNPEWNTNRRWWNYKASFVVTGKRKT